MERFNLECNGVRCEWWDMRSKSWRHLAFGKFLNNLRATVIKVMEIFSLWQIFK